MPKPDFIEEHFEASLLAWATLAVTLQNHGLLQMSDVRNHLLECQEYLREKERSDTANCLNPYVAHAQGVIDRLKQMRKEMNK